MRHCFHPKLLFNAFWCVCVCVCWRISITPLYEDRKELREPNVHHFICFLYFAICFHFEIWWSNLFFSRFALTQRRSLIHFPIELHTYVTLLYVWMPGETISSSSLSTFRLFYVQYMKKGCHLRALFECHWCHSKSTCNNNSNKRIKCCMEPRKFKIHVDKNIKLRYYTTDFIHTIWACHVGFHKTNHTDSIRNWWELDSVWTDCIHALYSRWIYQRCPFSLAFSL